jgi:hypothetical protein
VSRRGERFVRGTSVERKEFALCSCPRAPAHKRIIKLAASKSLVPFREIHDADQGVKDLSRIVCAQINARLPVSAGFTK